FRLFDDYREEDFYGLPRKYSIVARVEVKFPKEPRFRDRQHFVLSDINGAKIEAITYMYETVKHFDNLLHEKHVYKMHNVKFSLHPGEFNFRHLNGPMELCLDQQTIVEPYTVPIQMAPFPKQILLNLADIAELPNRTLVDIMAVVVHLDTIQRTMWGPFRKIVIMDASITIHPCSCCHCTVTFAHSWSAYSPAGFFMENGEPTETDQMEHNDGRTPLTNISNTITIADENGSKRLGPNVDAKERKRQRERERYAAMTVEQKNEKSRKRREASQRNKGPPIQTEASRVSLSDGCSTIDFTNFATQDDDSDWLHRNETFKSDDVFTTRDLLTPGGVHETVGNTPNHNLGRAAYFRERYKNLTPAERELNREHLRLYNNTPKRKGSKIEYIRKRRALLADTLSQESIAMESPTYTPEVVHPTTDAIEPNGSALTPSDWVIPDIASNPFLPASTQTEDADSLRMSTRPLRRKQHVPRGERQAILARRNRQFEASISRNMANVAEDIISDAEEEDDSTQTHMSAKINNNVDDDDGVVFEDDADENEGYLFAGQ
ncbi:hypothetical protein ACJX0J_006055, partial [Zea mays]